MKRKGTFSNIELFENLAVLKAKCTQLATSTIMILIFCSESQCSTGYSPFLTFDVHDLNASIPQLIQMGAVLDGGIRYETYGTVAAVRSPDGHMVGLIERANLPDGGDTSVAAAKAAERHLNVKK